MSTLRRVTQLALIATLGISVWGTICMMKTDGLVGLMTKLRDHGPHYLPGTSEPIRRFYTGVGPVDEQLAVLCVFFWSIIDGSHPEYVQHITDFCFQFAIQYAVVVLEGSRPGNEGKWITYATFFGAVMQNAGVTNTLPVFALMYIATSPTVSMPTLSSILPSTPELVSLPISILLGYFVPVAFMRSSKISIDGQQIWLGVWQAFPLWVGLFQRVISGIMSQTTAKGTPKEDQRANIKSLRRVYAFLRYLSTFGHLISWGLVLKTLEAPHLFATGIADTFSPSRIYLPASISPSFQVMTIGEGAHLFLQYDRIGSSAAIVIFAYFLYAQALSGSSNQASFHLKSIVSTIFTAVLIGPAGAAVSLLEARDEELIERHESSKKGI